MFHKVLVANRGEIALRIIRALKELGMKSVAVYSQSDANALHVKFADEAVCIGPSQPKESYLNIPSLISAAEVTRADAVHPGYGFLAESAEFAEVCERCDLTWIGPSPATMRTMGDKIAARKAMQAWNVPVLPGSGLLENEDEALAAAQDIGFPVILKAAAGGGGRGMKIVRSSDELVNAWQLARSEAKAAFGSADIYMEKYCQSPRHIEVQIIGDKHGRYTHLGERECSLQRRHQKIVEEAPACGISAELRESLLSASVTVAKKLEYQSVGTLEFLVDAQENYFFMEMNTRLQVEHPVTEMVTGIDLVREQIRIAAGEPLSCHSERLPRGHSIELRINAEDPVTFVPSPGKIEAFNLPGGGGVRVDTHAYEGYSFPPYYDSLIAKLIVHDDTRAQAIVRMRRCLDELVIRGIKTNIALHKRILDSAEFQAGDVDTRFVDRLLDRE